ncbi:MAG: AAA family ATPase [Clostridia bacterium]|nr:AAA family ATPase [Clostridia bacterium]
MVGREKEIKELNRLYDRNRADLVAIYGRRRVGKTFLVDETFGDRITFRHAGLSPADQQAEGLLSAQLEHFYRSLKEQGMDHPEKPSSWMEAFYQLECFLKQKDDGKRQIVFLDEMPWLDTPRSGFIQAFEGFWNNWACHRKNIMVIVCGSANSWILDQLINNHGGLYNRVTYEIKLSPLSLQECEQLFTDNGVRFSRYDIAQSYMIFGGIPYYLGYMDTELSLAQNVDQLFFKGSARLADEFVRLFDSIFDDAEMARSVIRLLHTRNAGFTRKEIIEKLHLSNGSRISKVLQALTDGDFVTKYVPFGMSKRAVHYKLTDPFCLFWLRFVEDNLGFAEDYWQQRVTTQPVAVWRGYAFENLCFNHIPQIKRALGVSGVITTASAWSKRPDDQEGTQIDLLLFRNDNVVNMCELKFYGIDFAVDLEYYKKILHRQELLLGEISPKCAVHSTLITTYGLKKNEYASAFLKVITLDDLFEKP